MKKLLLYILSFLSVSGLFAQTSFKSYDLGGDDYGNNIAKGQAAAYVCGSTSLTGAGSYDQFLVKVDAAGNPLWQAQFGGAALEIGRALTVSRTNDGVFVAGTTNSYSTSGKSDISVSLIDTAGNYQGSIVLGFDSLVEFANDVIATSDSGFLIVGQTQANGDNNHNNVFAVKFSGQGAPQWMRTFGTPFGDDIALRAVEIPGIGYFICGNSDANTAGMRDGYFVAVAPDGVLQGQLLIGTAGDDDGRFVTFADNKLIFAGITGSTSGPNRSNIYITALNPEDLSIAWSKVYGGDSATAINGLHTDPMDGNLVVGGQSNRFGNGEQGLLFKVNPTDGSVVWAKTWGASGDQFLQGSEMLDDGTNLIAGFGSFGSSPSDFYIAHSDANGDFCNFSANTTMRASDYFPTVAGPSLVAQRDSVVEFPVQGPLEMTHSTHTVTVLTECSTSASEYTVSTSSNPIGAGTTSGGGTYSTGSSVTVTATANSGFTFVNWTDNGTEVSTNSSYTFTISSNKNLVANFIATYTVSTSSNPLAGGTTSGGGTYSNGTSVTVTATVNSDYTFVNWTENGSEVSNNTSYTFSIASDRTLVANFNAITYNINTSSNPPAGGTTSGGGTVTSGSSVTVSATANSGYSFVNWTENGSEVSTNSSYTFTAASNRSLVANFLSTTGQHLPTSFKAYDLGADDYGNNIALGDFSAFVCGSTSLTGAGSYDQFLVKVDTVGNPLWQVQFGGSALEIGRALTVSKTNDGVFVAGTTNSYSTSGKSDISVSLIDTGGTYMGSLVLGFDSLVEYANDVIATSDSGFLIVGQTQANGDNNHNNMFAVKFSGQGGPQWMKTFGTPFGNDAALRAVEIPGLGYFVCGSSDAGTAGMRDGYFVAVDPSGVIQGQLLIGSGGDDDGRFVTYTNDKLIFSGITGNTSGPNRNNIYITALNPENLSIAWSKVYGGDSATTVNGLNVDQTDGNVVVAGQSNAFGNGEQGLLFKVNSADGSIIWAKSWGTTGSEFLQGSAILQDGSSLITGYGSFGSSPSDFFVAHSDANGDFCDFSASVSIRVSDYNPTVAGPSLAEQRDSVVEFPVQGPLEMTHSTHTVTVLTQCQSTSIQQKDISKNIMLYPNPTDGKLLIRTDAPWMTNVKVAVYNMLGVEVKTATIAPNTKEFVLDISGNAAGMYLITFNDGNSTKAAKVMLK